jgi:hypothetical protein
VCSSDLTMFDKFPTKEQVKNDIEKIIKR